VRGSRSLDCSHCRAVRLLHPRLLPALRCLYFTSPALPPTASTAAAACYRAPANPPPRPLPSLIHLARTVALGCPHPIQPSRTTLPTSTQTQNSRPPIPPLPTATRNLHPGHSSTRGTPRATSCALGNLLRTSCGTCSRPRGRSRLGRSGPQCAEQTEYQSLDEALSYPPSAPKQTLLLDRQRKDAVLNGPRTSRRMRTVSTVSRPTSSKPNASCQLLPCMLLPRRLLLLLSKRRALQLYLTHSIC
jgi:hypothetical protein